MTSTSTVATSSTADRTAAGVLCCVVLLIGLLVNLPFEYTQHDGYWVKQQATTDARISVVDTRTIVHAGWPLRFLSQHHTDDATKPTVRSWLPWRLCTNGCVFLVGSVIAFRFVIRRKQIIGSAVEPSKTQLRFDVAAATIMVMIPVIAVAAAFVQSRRHEQLALGLAKQGNCYLASSLPGFLAERMPHVLVGCFHRIRAAELFVPNDRQVTALLSLDSLVGCRLQTSTTADSSFDPASLEALAGHKQLTYFSLRNFELDHRAVQSISRVPYLVELTLQNAGVADDHFVSFANLDRLSTLRLLKNPCRFAAIPPESKWMQTLKILELSCPPTGVEDTLNIQSWPMLERLTLSRRAFRDNPAELHLTISDCPRLTYMMLDRVQKFALRLSSLPRLTDFGHDMSMEAFYLPPSVSFPGACWCSELRLESMPNLLRLDCLTTDLSSVVLRDVPSIRSFALGSFRQHGGGGTSSMAIEPKRMEHLMNQFGQLNELESLRLELCSLEDVDLSQFAKNQSIRDLHLAATGISVDQARQLASMKQLTGLQLGECELTSDDFAYFLSELPNLRSLGCNIFNASELSVQENSQLERLVITAVNAAQSVRIENAPQLQSSLYLLSAPQELAIVNAPSLIAIVVDGQWPKSSTLSGLRMLRCFAAGGPEVNDQVLDELRYCSQLDELTLAYANLSRESLQTIRQFTKLTTLHLPSAAVDDAVVEGWRPIRRLQHVNLDETNIDLDTIRWAKNLPNLKSFSINGVRLSPQAQNEVSALGNIQNLGLARTDISKDQIQQLLAPGRTADLTLGGVELDDDLIDSLVECKSLARLTVEPNDLPVDRLKTLLQRRPNLVVHFTQPNGSLTPELQAELDVRESRSRRNLFNAASRSPLPNSSNARIQHIAPRIRPAMESTIRMSRKSGKLNIERLRQSLAAGSAGETDDSTSQKGASSSSTASESAAFASSTAAPVTPP